MWVHVLDIRNWCCGLLCPEVMLCAPVKLVILDPNSAMDVPALFIVVNIKMRCVYFKSCVME